MSANKPIESVNINKLYKLKYLGTNKTSFFKSKIFQWWTLLKLNYIIGIIYKNISTFV